MIELNIRDQEKMLIGEKLVPASNGEWIDNIDPRNGEVICQIASGEGADAENAISLAQSAYEDPGWMRLRPSERGQILRRMAQLIREHAEPLAQIETLDTGKAISVARTDVQMAASYYEYYGGFADKIQGETIPVTPNHLNYTIRQPRGVCLIIVPWNFPIQTTSRGLAPALAAGNAVIIKPAEEASLTPIRLGQLALEAGFPPGIVNVVTGVGEKVGSALVSHPGVDHVTFTGSVETGRFVAKAASDNVFPAVLELGGKGAHLIFEDADLDAALGITLRAAFRVSGQSCSSGSRLLLQNSVAEPFIEKLVERTGLLKMGPGQDDPDLGPLISRRQYERVMEYIHIGEEEGADLLVGGRHPPGPQFQNGFYVEPTIFGAVSPSMRIFQEEIFGPVLTVTKFSDEEEGIDLANNSQYGLVAGVWTENLGRAHRVTNRIDAGQIYVNNWASGVGVATPFGGFKKSGLGREKGLETFHHYTQLKAISIYLGGE